MEKKEWRQVELSRPSDYLLGCGGYCERRERCWKRVVLRQTPEERKQTQTGKGTKVGRRGISGVILSPGIRMNFLGICLHPRLQAPQSRNNMH